MRMTARPVAPWAVPALIVLALAADVALVPAMAASPTLRDPLRTDAALDERTSGIPPSGDCGARLPDAKALRLPDAVDLALCRNPDTRSAWAVARQQAAALGVARSDWLPGVDATGGETWRDGSSGATLATDGGTRRTTDAALDVSWTLFDFGGRSARTEAATRLLDAAAAQLGGVAQRVVFDAVEAYYNVVATDAALAAAREAEASAQKSLDVARGRFEVGVATRADLLQAETALAQAALDRVQAEGQLAVARGQLAVVIGEAADRRLELAPEPLPESVPPLTARVADLLADAARQRPDLAAVRAQRDAAAADVAAARASGRPSISVGVAQNYTDTQGFPSQDYRSFGVNVRWPIFSGFSTTYRVRQAEAARDARDADVQRTELQVSLDVWTAYASLATAGQQLDATAKLVTSAAENERVALGRYQAGVGTIIDVLAAQSAAANARRQRIGAERAWQVSRAQLALATGRLANAAPLAMPASSPGNQSGTP